MDIPELEKLEKPEEEEVHEVDSAVTKLNDVRDLQLKEPGHEEVTRNEARHELISTRRKLLSLCCCCSDWMLRIWSPDRIWLGPNMNARPLLIWSFYDKDHISELRIKNESETANITFTSIYYTHIHDDIFHRSSRHKNEDP